MTNGKHEYYELLNLLGYGLAKFNNEFIQQFNCNSKEQFYQYFVDFGIVKTKSVVKNRQDLFDPYFDNGRLGWWQKKDVYEHRKILIDGLFGDGYDFQITTKSNNYLAEVKGIRQNKGQVRLTENEYIKACEYKYDYVLTLVLNLNEIPRFLVINNPAHELNFKEVILQSKQIKEYHLEREIF